MKKVVSFVLTVCLLLSALVLPAYAVTDEYGRDITTVDVYTPVGTIVGAMYRSGALVEDEIVSIENGISEYESRGAEKLTDATISFNCFAFAFLGRDTEKLNAWLPDMTAFIEDGSYTEIAEPVVGCIVVYWDSCDLVLRVETEDVISNIPFGDEEAYIHAGLVTAVDAGEDGIISDDEVTVISKWGIAGLYCHTVDCAPYYKEEEGYRETLTVLISESGDTVYTLFSDHTHSGVKYYLPNIELYENLTMQYANGTETDKNGLFTDTDGEIRYYTADRAWQAGVVSDQNGNYYYIDDTLKAVKNASVTIPLNHANGLLPDGVYTTDEDGVIEALPTLVSGESLRNGVVALPDGQIKTLKDGYPAAGQGLYQLGSDYYFAGDTPVVFGTHEDGTVNYDLMLTDGATNQMTEENMNGLLPYYEYELDGMGKVVNLPTKIDMKTGTLNDGLMRLPDGTVVLYKDGVPQTGATAYTDPVNGFKYQFTYGGKTYSVIVSSVAVKAATRNVRRMK